MSNPKLNWFFALILICVFLALPLATPTYILFILFLMLVNLCLAQSWNLCGGFAGLISLSHAAFIGLGGYTAAYWCLMWPRSWIAPYLGVITGGCLAALFAFLISFPLLRLRGAYFAIGTLAVSEALKIWMINWPGAGGPAGIRPPAYPQYSLTHSYYIALFIAIATNLIVWKIKNSKLGIAASAIRDNVDACEIVGVDTFKSRAYILTISAFFAGMAGGVSTMHSLMIEPYAGFSFLTTLWAMNMVFLGGVGTILGPIIGSIIITIIREEIAIFAEVQLLITCLLLIMIITFLPEGCVKYITRVPRLSEVFKSAKFGTSIKREIKS